MREVKNTVRAGDAVFVLIGGNRIAEALAQLAAKPPMVVYLQGKAPITPPWFVEALIETKANEAVQVTAIILSCGRGCDRPPPSGPG